MDAQDGQVPAPRRSALPRLRRPVSPSELPFAAAGDEDTPRVADLSALLHDIDSLRLTLQTDLSLAAAALDAGADELAGELVDGDLSEVRAFAARATRRLAELEDAELEGAAELDEADAVRDEEPVTVPLRRRRLMSAGPLMAAAAALIGFVAFVPDRGAVSTPDTTMTSAAMAGYELSRLAEQGAPDEQLLLAAEELNDELAQLIAQAADDPLAAQQALMLLETTTAVLSRQGDSNVLRSVMAETRALRARLREALPASASRPGRPSRPAVRVVVPVLPRVQEEPEKERAAEEPKPSPKPASPSPSPSPSQAQPSPSEAPSDEPSPGGTDESEGPLPNTPGGDTLPGI